MDGCDHAGTGSWNWVLWKIDKCSKLLSHLSSPLASREGLDMWARQATPSLRPLQCKDQSYHTQLFFLPAPLKDRSSFLP